MRLPSMLQGASLMRLLQGAAAGAIATIFIGFNWGGWTLDSTATRAADNNARNAVVAVLVPICVDRFQHAADASANLVELKKVSAFRQADFVERGGWATLSGSDRANSAVADACARILGNQK
jgi:hypothetical protein